MYRLVFLSGRYQGKRLVVRQAVTLVGHDAKCHLCLPDDDQIAPRHARFDERGTGVFLTSLSADHPIQYNGEPVREAVRLTHNDELQFGQTRVRFQDIIEPHTPARQSPGLLQPATLLIAAAILLLEIALLLYLINWPRHLIRPETEAADLARAEEIRAVREAEKTAESNTAAQAEAPASMVTLPGTAPEPAAAPAPIANPPLSPAAAMAAPTSASPAVLEVLEEADFEAADTNDVVVEPPPLSQADPRLEDARRMLTEARAAAQFSDYTRANRLLKQIHQALPGFLPAHIEHARLLEARGDLDGAQQRWTQILGLAEPNSPFHSLAASERQRLERIQALQTHTLEVPLSAAGSHLPRHIRIQPPSIRKMPSDTDIAEMRVLTTTLETASEAPIFKEAAIQAFITFYDINPDGEVRPTRAITTASPILLGNAFANRRQIPLEATYVVPRGLRTQEEHETGHRSSYYGYTLHVFAGQILQDASAKPKKLLERPIQLSTNAPPAP